MGWIMTKRGLRRWQEWTHWKRRTKRFPGYVQPHPGKTPGKVCSCVMCGNPRRWFGLLTMQERRARSKAQDMADYQDAIRVEQEARANGEEPISWEEAKRRLGM